MTYYIVRERIEGCEWRCDDVCHTIMDALKKQRRIIRYSEKCYKPVKNKKFTYRCDDCIMEIIEK